VKKKNLFFKKDILTFAELKVYHVPIGHMKHAAYNFLVIGMCFCINKKTQLDGWALIIFCLVIF